MLVLELEKCDFLPAIADRKSRGVEIALLDGLDESEQGHGLLDRRRARRLHQLCEGLDAGTGCGKRFGQRFGRGPACAAIGGNAFGFVERRRIEPGFFRKSGR